MLLEARQTLTFGALSVAALAACIAVGPTTDFGVLIASVFGLFLGCALLTATHWAGERRYRRFHARATERG